MTDSLIVVGRFPPPVDGQSVVTKTFADMMCSQFDVVRIDTGMPSSISVVKKIRRYIDSGAELKRALAENPSATIVWQSISPRVSGHARDWITIMRHTRGRTIIAVCHPRFGLIFKRILTRRSAARMITRLSKIVFHDKLLQGECSSWIPAAKSARIPNSPEPQTLWNRAEVQTRIASGPRSPFRILYLSNMIREKGYLTLLNAAARLKELDVQFRVDYVGGWYSKQEESDFRSDIIRLKLQNEIEHHGAVHERSRILKFHMDADAFVLPSYHPTEASPMSIIEALSAGTPIVTTRQGGIPEMVTDGREAILVDPKDPPAIAEALIRLGNQTVWKTMASAAYDRFESHFHPDIVHSKWIDLLKDVNLQDR